MMIQKPFQFIRCLNYQSLICIHTHKFHLIATFEPKIMLNGPFFTSPEVVAVPAHFFTPEQQQTQSSVSNESSVLKIQSMFRGFLVRKSMKKISVIRNRVCEVERSINNDETVELIRIDAKERMRVNEALMLLLFELDSIRGVDFGVRELRKAVINKSISLQEIVMNNDGVVDVTVEDVKEIGVNCESVEVVDEGMDDRKRSVEVLDKLMADNEEMMALVTRMFERDEMQTRMINSLSRRVEMLEKMLKPRKKKNKRRSL